MRPEVSTENPFMKICQACKTNSMIKDLKRCETWIATAYKGGQNKMLGIVIKVMLNIPLRAQSLLCPNFILFFLSSLLLLCVSEKPELKSNILAAKEKN